jgi:hypothetical protein
MFLACVLIYAVNAHFYSTPPPISCLHYPEQKFPSTTSLLLSKLTEKDFMQVDLLLISANQMYFSYRTKVRTPHHA